MSSRLFDLNIYVSYTYLEPFFVQSLLIYVVKLSEYYKHLYVLIYYIINIYVDIHYFGKSFVLLPFIFLSSVIFFMSPSKFSSLLQEKYKGSIICMSSVINHT